MFCTRCGKETEDGSSFCPECGQDLRAFSTQQPQSVAQVQPVAVTFTQPESQPVAEPVIVPVMVSQAEELAEEPVAAPAVESVAGPIVEPVIEPVIESAAEPAAASVEEIGNEPKVEATGSPLIPEYAAPAPAVYTSQEIPAAGQQTRQSGDAGTKIGGFFKEYIKSPITAVAGHAKNEFWLWGLISISAYLLIKFFVSLVGVHSFSGFGFQFGYLAGDIIRFATLIFAYFLFQTVFKVKKKSLPSIISVVGLAFLPLLPLYLIGLVFTRVIAYSNILSGFMTVVYVVAGIILYSELKESSDDKSGMHSLLTVAVSMACMPLISGIIDAIVSNAYYFYYY